MRVLGLDPGTATTGYGVVDGKGSRLRHIAHGTIDTPAHTGFETRLVTIYDGVRALLAEHQPDVVAIEKLYFKQNVTTGIGVAQARGVLALAAAQAGLPIREFTPAQAKTAITGYGKADKRQMQEMIKVLLNLKEIPRPDDAADALGIAICGIHGPGVAG
jgi:crossover junction endodeoxyribonuclease RuvC